MKKKSSFTIEWSKTNGINFCLMVFDDNLRGEEKVIAHYDFDDISCSIFDDEELEYPILEDWQGAVEKRIGHIVDWDRLNGESGGSVTFTSNYKA